MNIRFGRMEDLDFIVAADEETRILEKRSDLKLSPLDIRKIETQIQKKDLLVLEDGKGILGFISYISDFQVIDLPYKVFWIDLVFVKKEHRKKGIGRRLYDEAFKIAKERGYSKVHAEIYTANDGSKSAHEKMGFKPKLTIYEREV